jgi:hypothetical protein
MTQHRHYAHHQLAINKMSNLGLLTMFINLVHHMVPPSVYNLQIKLLHLHQLVRQTQVAQGMELMGLLQQQFKEEI